MNKKKIFIFIFVIVFSLLFFKSPFTNTNAKILNCSAFTNLIRVGISSNNFKTYEKSKASFTSYGRFYVKDKHSGRIISRFKAKDIITIKILKKSFALYLGKKLIEKDILGPVSVTPIDTFPINVVGLKRKGKSAFYRGEFELVKTSKHKNKFFTVNILPLKDYLKGVVPNEMPVRFGLEALKAQAIAARNYAIKPRDRMYTQFDVFDSVESQVYFGYLTENPLGTKAVEETEGLIGLYDDDIILALYSSTSGGYTENYENAFSKPKTTIFPADPLPYLKGKPDKKSIPVLKKEKTARKFYKSKPKTNDNKSGYFRWKKSWKGWRLASTLNLLRRQSQ